MTSNNQFIICGTDTDIGKTVISALFTNGLNASYWKPIQSGSLEKTDSNTIEEIGNISKDKIIKEAYKFSNPVSPHWAAEIDKVEIDLNQLNKPLIQGPLIIETAGGLLVPITRKYLQIDQIKKWDLPVILVCRSGLGTLNHSLMSLRILRDKEIKIAGIILNGPKHLDNPKTLEEIGQVNILAEIPFIDNLSAYKLNVLWMDLNIQSKIDNLAYS